MGSAHFRVTDMEMDRNGFVKFLNFINDDLSLSLRVRLTDQFNFWKAEIIEVKTINSGLKITALTERNDFELDLFNMLLSKPLGDAKGPISNIMGSLNALGQK